MLLDAVAQEGQIKRVPDLVGEHCTDDVVGRFDWQAIHSGDNVATGAYLAPTQISRAGSQARQL